MPPKKPSRPEDEFIAREEKKRRELDKIRRDQEKAAAAREPRPLLCPAGCDVELVEQAFRDILIDRCPTCGGVWLDPGELEKISSDDARTVRAFFNFFAGRSE
jgi:hypothetical protein